MFEKLFNQFVISFRESIEASLVVMAVMITIKRRGDVRMKRAALWAIGSAIVTCIIGGYFLGTIALVNNHGVELALYLAAMLAVLTMVIWMMKEGKNLKNKIEQRITSYKSNNSFLPMLSIFLFVFLMITREGFEMVLLLLAFGKGIGGGILCHGDACRYWACCRLDLFDVKGSYQDQHRKVFAAVIVCTVDLCGAVVF